MDSLWMDFADRLLLNFMDILIPNRNSNHNDTLLDLSMLLFTLHYTRVAVRKQALIGIFLVIF